MIQPIDERQNFGNIRISSRIYYEITSLCNLSCTHCSELYNSSSPRLNSENLIEFHQGLSERFHITDSVVTGGEPTVHKDFPKIVEGLANFGNVVVTTNGTVLKPEVQARLLEQNPNVLLQISMDGATEKTFDFVRGEGVFKKVTQLIEYLVSQGLNKQVGLSMTIMKHSIQEVEAMIYFAESNGLALLHFPQLLPVGNAKKSWQTIAPDTQSQRAIEELLMSKMCQEDRELSISVNRIDQVWSRTISNGQEDCLEIFTLKVDPDGNLLPCPATSNRSLSLGSIYDTKLPQTIETRLSERAIEYRGLAGPNLSSCKGCSAFSACRARFCENCGLLGEPDIMIAEKSCEILSEHYKGSLQALSVLVDSSEVIHD